MKKLNFSKRRLKAGSLATVITVGFVAIVVLLNVVLGVVFEMYPLNIDLTSDSRFSLTDDSINIIEDIDSDVRINVFCEESLFENQNEYLKQAYEIINNYKKYNSKISVNFIDPEADPTAAQAYPDLSLSLGDIVVETDARYRYVAIGDLFSTTTTEYGTTTYSSQAEQAMTNALLYVTDTDPTTAVILNVPSNVDLTGIRNLLESNNYTIETQNLQTEDINTEADLLIFPQPSTELSYETIQKLSDYLDNDSQFGKNVLFVPDKLTTIDETLELFLRDWGIEVGDSFVYETNTANYYVGRNNIVVTAVDEEYATALNTSLMTIASSARPVTALLEEENANRGNTIYMSSSSSAVLRPFSAGDDYDPDAQEKGTYNVMVNGYRFRYDQTNGEKIFSNLLVISSADMLTSSWLSEAGFANGKAAITAVNSITENTTQFSALAVDMTSETISITSDQVNIYRAILNYILPLLLIIGGFVIWLRRRHL